MGRGFVLVLIGLFLVMNLALGPASAVAEEPAAPSEPAAPVIAPFAPPSAFKAVDAPNDAGHGILFTWTPSPDDAHLLGYEIIRVLPGRPEAEWPVVATAAAGASTYTFEDDKETLNEQPNPTFIATGTPITFSIRGRTADGALTAFGGQATATAVGNWYHTGKTNILVATFLFGFAVVWFIRSARSGKKLYIRPIGGLNAVDEAIGRATEMGKPILFVLGSGTAGDIATIAGYSILSRVAKRTAEYQTPIMVPVQDPVMLAMGQEVVRQAYLEAGRPDVYRPETVFYMSAMQFPYVAAVNGLMMRERPAANFYMGVFFAESLLLAETGSVAGSIQISGTDQIPQIPFFVAATDYTLIGEELYAASAYLSQEPTQMGPLKAQDWTKLVIIVVIVLGVLAETLLHWHGILKLVQTPT